MMNIKIGGSVVDPFFKRRQGHPGVRTSSFLVPFTLGSHRFLSDSHFFVRFL